MITFIDGPAKGKVLHLRLAPLFLRVTEHAGKWDGLDQPEDTPRPEEKLYAYVREGDCYTVHMRMGNGRGGFYAGAKYRFIEPQPSAEIMTNHWASWKWGFPVHSP